MAIYLGSNQVRAAIMPDGLPNIQSLSISQNGTYSISGSINGYNPITVNVLPTIQSLTISQNGTYSVISGTDGYSPITVNVLPNIQSLTVSENGVYLVSGNVSGYSPITVNITQKTLSSVIAYSGIGSMTSNNSIYGYTSGIIFSSVMKQPDNFIVLLTPQSYNGDGNYTAVPYAYNWSLPAVCNIIYNGVTTNTYLMSMNDAAYQDDNTFINVTTSSSYLISWSYNSISQTLICSFTSSWTAYFATMSLNYGNYPAPAYTLYYI